MAGEGWLSPDLEGGLLLCLFVGLKDAWEDPRKMKFSLIKDYISKRSQQKLCWATNPKTWIFNLLRGLMQDQASLLQIPLSHPWSAGDDGWAPKVTHCMPCSLWFWEVWAPVCGEGQIVLSGSSRSMCIVPSFLPIFQTRSICIVQASSPRMLIKSSSFSHFCVWWSPSHMSHKGRETENDSGGKRQIESKTWMKVEGGILSIIAASYLLWKGLEMELW